MGKPALRGVGSRQVIAGGPAKRALDICAGSLLALLSIPVVVVLCVAVCLSLRTWRPIFVQERTGRGGRSFRLAKLRTLPCDAPTAADKYTIAGIKTTRLGRFLRRTHLDELPQLLLVPTGRMSLVGPRPEMPWLLTQFDPSFVATRTLARPGCTGLWQIGADAARLIGEAPEYDLYYLRHASVRLDLWVIWQSVLVMVGRPSPSWAEVSRRAERRVGAVAPSARPVVGVDPTTGVPGFAGSSRS